MRDPFKQGVLDDFGGRTGGLLALIVPCMFEKPFGSCSVSQSDDIQTRDAHVPHPPKRSAWRRWTDGDADGGRWRGPGVQ